MKISIEIHQHMYRADLAAPIDLSIPIGPNGPRAWYVDPVRIEPVMTDRFTGSVALGGAVNFRNIRFNPHGHGTHTETQGHIDAEVQSINQTLRQFFFLARLITVEPTAFSGKEKAYVKHGDAIITAAQLERRWEDQLQPEALIIRTLPNTHDKLSKNYSNTNPAYFEPEALRYMRSKGILHLLTDLPSVDREEDGGKLLAHHAFWKSGFPTDTDCTISEMIYAANEVADGYYLLNLQIAPFENDATPSKPVIFKLDEI